MRATCGPVEGLLRTSVSLHHKLDRGPHSYILMRSDVSKRGLYGYRQIMRCFDVLRKTHMIRHRVLPMRVACNRYVINRMTADARTSSTVMMVTQRPALPTCPFPLTCHESYVYNSQNNSRRRRVSFGSTLHLLGSRSA